MVPNAVLIVFTDDTPFKSVFTEQFDWEPKEEQRSTQTCVADSEEKIKDHRRGEMIVSVFKEIQSLTPNNKEWQEKLPLAGRNLE